MKRTIEITFVLNAETNVLKSSREIPGGASSSVYIPKSSALIEKVVYYKYCRFNSGLQG